MPAAKFLIFPNTQQMALRQFGLLNGLLRWHETKESPSRAFMRIMVYLQDLNSRTTVNIIGSSFPFVELGRSTRTALPSVTSRLLLNGQEQICFILRRIGPNMQALFFGLRQLTMRFGSSIACQIWSRGFHQMNYGLLFVAILVLSSRAPMFLVVLCTCLTPLFRMARKYRNGILARVSDCSLGSRILILPKFRWF